MDASSHPPAGQVPVFGWKGRAGRFRWSTNWGRSSWGLLLAGLLLYTFIGTSSASTIRVPQDYSTIQAAINAAQDGDTVLVSPGTYAENPVISGKSVILASEFHTTGDPG